MILCNNQFVETTYFELKSMPVKPGSLYHDEPVDIPREQGYCVVCGKNKIAMLVVLARVEGCLSSLPHIRGRLLSKDA